ncbi:anti-phage-associated DUF1156 domain-containing protein [Shewanella xiamenensis]|uniref:anti-phage-associated DUF1156 domain-containing protein n=1 Tax=Shewanella xiamenensis TaxID=332186 RepID=UPI00313CA454
MAELTPFALKDAPALIEAVYPAQKISIEAQAERKAVQSQTLTGLGSYWKGRKPLILVRSIVLGSLLPQTDDAEKDLEIFEMLMGFDIECLAKRAFIQNSIKPSDIAASISLQNPWDYFSHNLKITDPDFSDVSSIQFPIDSNAMEIKLRWNRDIDEQDKIDLLIRYLKTIDGYEEKANLGKRCEQIDPEWLYSHIWTHVNRHYKKYGVSVGSHQELVNQFGILRFNKTPTVGDSFSGGGSIPFEAARVGFDVVASDLNPVALMLSWGALNVLGVDTKRQEKLIAEQERVKYLVESELNELGVEVDSHGNRAKAYLYCSETICPQTGWRVPMSPTWVISASRNVVAKLVPNYQLKRFDIEVESGVSNNEFKQANNGTIQKGNLVYELDGKTYSTPIKTLRGDHKDDQGISRNKLRKWQKNEFCSRTDDVFQERLYAIHWIDGSSLNNGRQDTFFAAVTDEDLAREEKVKQYLGSNFTDWQSRGFIPDMEIEPGYNTSQPIRERGWSHWHHLFDYRSLLTLALTKKAMSSSDMYAELLIGFAKQLDWLNKGCYFGTGAARESISHMFSNQALNVLFNYGTRSAYSCYSIWNLNFLQWEQPRGNVSIVSESAEKVDHNADYWITDPPYADAVNYHEITEFFISWLRKDPPAPFEQWNWDSRRALAIKGSGDDFRKGMVNAYKAMADHMPDNGMQCVMFTHQDTGVWSDMIGIFWASGLQVVGAWYIATETTSELKKGGYVQGTVILMLRKRPAGENSGFKQRLLPAVRAEVKRQIETMMHLNDEVKDKLGEPVFNDSDLQMAGYAAALKVLTSYTHIGGEDVTSFALRPRTKGEVTVVDEIVQQAAEAANSLLVPEGLSVDTWQKINGIQRFYLRMMDIETTGASKLDNYQNFAKAFRVEDYGRVMGNMTANKAQLKQIPEFASRDLTDSTEIGSTWLGHLVIGLQQILNEKEPQSVISQLQADLPDFMEVRPILIDMLTFIEKKAPEKTTRDAAEVLGARLKNMRALGQ